MSYSAQAAHEQTVARHRAAALAEAVSCAHCPMLVHPSRSQEHMSIHHPDVLLTPDERDLYAKCNRDIEEGLDSLARMAKALADVRDRKLYRENYPTFEAYCKERWGKSRAWGNARVTAAYIIELLATFVDSDQLPVRESQTRALAAIQAETPGDAFVSEDFLARAWMLAVNTTPNRDPDEVTAAHLKRVGKVINEAITTGGYIDPGTGESEPVSPVAFHAAVLVDQVESLSRQWEHMTRKRQTVYKGLPLRTKIMPFETGQIVSFTFSLETNLTELEAALVRGKPITVTLTTPKEDAS